MVRLREIPRTATFAWSPGTGSPYIATGTRAGAVDAEFSNETQLELWDLNLNNNNHGHELQPAASIGTDSRFHDVAWVRGNDDFPNGVIAGALENGSLDLWNAKKLMDRQEDSFMSRTSKHSAAIKALQFNPFRSELLATAGDKGELFISDLNNIQSPFRMGTSLARADDFECLDWNKNVPHILATGSSGGFVTVWDVKTKKESLTLNNLGRKAVSAVAWDPDKHTRLITAIPHDTEPVILVWDLRNSNTPEKTLRGHDGGVLSLSWCPQDNDLLLSCGKDNRTICWNPQTGESYGEFPIVTNWTFQTRWNPHNPNLLATASFDGKIGIHTIQNSNPDAHPISGSQIQTVNDEDFFSKAQSQPQGASFSLTKAPKWFERPCGASFGFGGKVISFTKSDIPSNPPHKRSSKLRISTFAIDAGVGTSTDAFENALKQKNLESICESKIAAATRDTEKADWKVIETLTSKSPKQSLIRYLGFSGANEEEADALSELPTDSKSKEAEASQLDVSSKKSNRLSAFFDSNADSDSFLSDLAATKGAKINNPFQIYSGSESDSDRKITRALLLGQYDKALNVCLQEERLSDAFMVAVCGGQACIDRVQKAYFNRKAGGPNYLRLLASVAGKNLWDVVYNAELTGWKEVMAIICTYASEAEFSDLCEALGDRLDEQWRTHNEDPDLRKNAAFCYLAGSKLEKVVAIWISELDEHEETDLDLSSSESSFSIHVRSLQSFIEKVTVFREVTGFQDTDREASSGWKLRALYERYTEYADIIASHGQLQIAEKYLNLLPQKYPGADIARNRIREAIHRPLHQNPNASQSIEPAIHSQNTKSLGNNQEKPAAPRRAPPAGGAVSSFAYPGAGQPNPVTLGPPTSTLNAPPSVAAPSRSPVTGNWNDTPESFFKAPTSRRGTPSAGTQPALTYPAAGQPNSSYGALPKSVPPLGPPPKGPVGPPPRMNSPATNIGHSYQQPIGHAGTGQHNSTYGPQPGTNQANPTYGLQPAAGQPNPAYGLQPGAGQPNSAYGLQPGAGQPNPAYGVQPGAGQPNPAYGSQPGTPLNRSYVAQPKSNLPLAPPPKGPIGPPPRIDSPSANSPNMYQPPERPPSSARNAYAPQQPPQTGRYTPSPSVQPVNSRYAPSPSVHQAASPALSTQQNIAAAQHEAPSGPPQSLPSGSRPGTAASQRPKPAIPVASKYPPGDRSHIPAEARTIYEILSSDMQRVKAVAPQSFKQQVSDTEKRLNILFDHLNNEDLLKEQTIKEMVQLAQSLQARDYEQAQMIHVDIMTNRTEECGNWMVGVKRLIGMSRATP